MAGGITGKWLLPAVCAVALFGLLPSQLRSAQYADVSYGTADLPKAAHADPSPEAILPGDATVDDLSLIPCQPLAAAPVTPRTWSIDYRFRSFIHSQTSYEIGTPDPPPAGWAPLSLLRFPLDSSWHGLQVGLDKPDWGVHVEWLTPISRTIHGDLADIDWNPPNPDGSFTDVGYMHETWTDGQMLTLDYEHKLVDHLFFLPLEVWPMAGFRWQRFDLTAYDLDQVKFMNQATSIRVPGDIITFNQQYYFAYIGGQLRTTLYPGCGRPIRLTFQGDWGATWAFNVDHHLLGDFFALQRGQGSSWHVALTAEMPINQFLSFGVQADFMQIRTTGKTWEVNRLPDVWTNGVTSYSDQTSLTAFVRLSY